MRSSRSGLAATLALAAVSMSSFGRSALDAADRMLAFGESTPFRKSKRQHQTAFNLGRTAAKNHMRWLKARGNPAGTKLAKRAAKGRIGIGQPR